MEATERTMPKGISSLYIISAFSTFSYAILYSSLSLFLTKQLGLSSALSNSLVGLFLVFNYILHLLGGVIGGRFLSNRSLFFSTTFIQTIGLFLLAISPDQFLYWGLSLFLAGFGVNVTAFNNMLTQRFTPDDHRRDKAFFMSYASMNIGFCGGFFVSGFFDYTNQYQNLFYISIFPNLITLFLMIFSWKALNDTDTPLSRVNNSASLNNKKTIGWVITFALIPMLYFCFHMSHLSNSIVIALSIVMFFVILHLAFRQDKLKNKQKIMTFLVLTVASILFWMVYFTGPMGITLFIKNNVDKNLFNYEVATQWILNINPIVVIVGAPLISMLLNNLRKKGYKISIPIQFFWAFLLLSLSFFILSFGILSANVNGYSSINWVILYFIIQSIAELLIAPVGYSMIGRIAPANLQGLLMGTWMMVSGVAASLSHYFSNAMTKAESTAPLISNSDYFRVFNQLGLWAFVGAIFLFLITKKINSVITPNDQMETSEIKAIS